MVLLSNGVLWRTSFYHAHIVQVKYTVREMSEPIPEPPWQTRKRRAAPRVALERDSIVDAALRVLDREGLDALTMRRVAEELGTGAGSLYWHVPSKEALLQLLIDRVADELVLPEPDPARWQEQIKELGHEMRALMRSHRDVARISLGRVPLGPNTVRFAEWLLALLRGAGLPDRSAALAGDLLALYVGAFAYEESLPFSSPSGEDASPDEIVAMIRDYFASLPPDRFPNVVALADELVSGGPDERFEFGLHVLVQGLAAQAGA
jgi:TetR/AcrR family tetracycline transcriptional repressor